MPDRASELAYTVETHPAAGLSVPARSAAAATLILGTGLQAASWLIFAEPDSAARYIWIAANPGPAEVAKVFDVLAMPFLIGAVVVYVMLGRQRSPRLAWIGGVLLGAGLVGLTAIQGSEVLAFTLAEDDVLDPQTLAEVTDGLSSPSAIAVLALFLPGVAIGLLLTAAALWRSRAAPRPAVLLLVAFLTIDLLGRGVEAHLIAFAAATWIAVTLLRARPIAAHMSRSNRSRWAS